MRKATSVILIVVMMVVYVPWDSRSAHGAGVSFSNPQILQFIPGADSYPSALQASNGTLWIVWQHYQYQPFYVTFNGASWSPVRTLPTGTRFNISPSMTQLGNGTIILLWSSNQTGYWNIYYKTLTGDVWSKTVQITSSAYNDFLETAVVSRNSALWVFWDRTTPTGSQQVYFKVLTGNSWSGDNPFTVDSTLNVTPGATVTRDGAIRVVWSKLVSGNYYVYSRVYNGLAWSGDTQLTSVATWDLEPAIVQDRNGTIWLFWSRQIQLQGGTNPVFQQKLFSKFSTDNGQTWSADTQLTFAGDVTRPIDDISPFAVQGNTPNVNGTVDHGLWVFFSSDLTGPGSDFDIYYLRSSQIYPVHDVAVTGVGAFPARMFPWGIRQLNIFTSTVSASVTDLGDFPETVTVTAQASNKTTFSLGSQQFPLSSGSSRIVSFNWNASLAPPGTYTITFSVSPIPGETIGNSADNTFSAKSLTILYPGDLNINGRVEILDASMFGSAWNSRIGDRTYNPDADIVYNGVVDILDASAFGANWQKSV